MFVLLNPYCHVTTFLVLSAYFISIVFLLKLSGIPLHSGVTVLQQFIFCFVRLFYKSGE